MARLRSTDKPKTAPNRAVFNWAIQVTSGFQPCIIANATEVAAIPPGTPIARPRNCRSMPRLANSSAKAETSNRDSPANLYSRQSKRKLDGSMAVHSTHPNITARAVAMAHPDDPSKAPQTAPERLRGVSPNEAHVTAGCRATPVAVTASVDIKSGIALRAMPLVTYRLSRAAATIRAVMVPTTVRFARSKSHSRCLRRFDRMGIEDPYFTVHAVPSVQQRQRPRSAASLATHQPSSPRASAERGVGAGAGTNEAAHRTALTHTSPGRYPKG